jgi:hypothetical protein
MNEITSTTKLREAILLLEIKQANEKCLLKEQFKTIQESLKPVNLIKNALNELVTAPDLKGNLLITGLSLAAGYLSKKVVIGSTRNPLKKILGTLLQVAVSNMASKNSDGIKSTALHLINTMFSKKDTSV